ncbi:hypothetical protein [Enterobacter kobei]|uniref:hypothetical protein n=1 Tax=Enterobacter kobei TaxID=208224 RepID=UPI00300C8C9D
MNKMLLTSVLSGIMCLIMVIYTSVSFYSREHFKCTAVTEVNYKDNKLIIISHYSFDGDIGSLVVEGELEKNDGTVFPFIIKNIFNYTRISNNFYLTSNNIVTQPTDLEKTGVVNEYLSQFFYKEGKKIVFEFSPQQPDSYTVYLGSFPVGFCKK